MKAVLIILVAALIFAVCRFVDLGFQKAFRSKQQHRSGLAVRVSKRNGVFGVGLILLGILSMLNSGGDKVMLWGGVIVLLMGTALAVRYLSHGIFYDGESFLVSSFGKKDREYRYDQILSQKLYVITGGSVVIELSMKDGSSVSLQSTMDGVYPFMDTAFAGWCMQTGTDMADCSFYDPSKSWWFPHEEEV